MHAPFAYVDDRFLAYTRAIGPLLGEDTKAASEANAEMEQRAWLEQVEKALPDDLRAGVMAQLKAPGPNERHRLESLIEALGSVGTWLTGDCPKEFAARVIATRGHLVHPSRRPPTKLLKGRELVQHTRALGWLLRSNLILELGMPIADLAARLRETEASSVAEEMAGRDTD